MTTSSTRPLFALVAKCEFDPCVERIRADVFGTEFDTSVSAFDPMPSLFAIANTAVSRAERRLVVFVFDTRLAVIRDSDPV